LESELFGYEKGAFTGAHVGGKKGLIELAHRGTLFLDEITSLSNMLQAKLLRLLSEQEIMKLGSDRIIPVNIRVVAATNEDIESCIKERGFRKDLYYRLSTFRLHLPSLRERPEDLIPLFLNFVSRYRKDIYHLVIKKERDIFQILIKETFPGNIRELENVVKRFCLLFKWGIHEDKIDRLLETCLEPKAGPCQQEGKIPGLKDIVENCERMVIQQLLENHNSHKDISFMLNLHRSSLWRKMKKYKIP
jgi:propionate catabolism operon transcriptional regulator